MAAADAECSEGAFPAGFAELVEGGEDEARAGCPDGMAEGDGTAAWVDFFRRNVVSREIQLMSLGGSQRGEDSKSLSGEGFVELDEIRVIGSETGELFRLGDGMNGAEPHAGRIAAGVGIRTEQTERFNTKTVRGDLGTDEKGDRTICEL